MDHSQRTELFHRLIWPLRADVLRAARLLVRDEAEADDLAQDALIKAFNGIDGFREKADGGGAKSWLMAILRNARVDRLRASKHFNDQVSLDAAEMDVADERAGSQESGAEVENPQELLERLSDGHLIQALQALPEEIRWTMLLVEVQGLSHEEAAEVLGVPSGTVKSRAFRGRGMMRTSINALADFVVFRTKGRSGSQRLL